MRQIHVEKVYAIKKERKLAGMLKEIICPSKKVIKHIVTMLRSKEAGK